MSAVYGTWAGQVRDETGRERTARIVSRVIVDLDDFPRAARDWNSAAKYESLDELAAEMVAWAVWAAAPAWLYETSPHVINDTTPPVGVRAWVAPDGAAGATVRELSAQCDAGELDEANGLGHGLVWLD